MAYTRKINPNFEEVTIKLLSPKNILDRSYGEVTLPETKNHRSHKPVEKGLFDQGIFGPEVSWQCGCGRYKGIRYKGTTCPKCHVEINHKSVRRERMGHIKLRIPVVHPWFFKYHPNVLASLIGINAKKIESIVYYASYVVVQAGEQNEQIENPVDVLDCITPKEYRKQIEQRPNNHTLPDKDPRKFIAKIGAEAIQMLLQRLDLNQLAAELRDKIANETSQQRRIEAIKRLNIVEAFRESGQGRNPNRPENIVITHLTVISPAYRPLVTLNDGRFVTSDYTRLLQRIVISNNRLRTLEDIEVPETILDNEKRILQECVDKLMDSTSTNQTFGETRRPLKSLSDHLIGKTGLFREGKRVDYSGRSVITVGPHLKINQCGLPKKMALVLFRTFVLAKLRERGIIQTYKEGLKLIEQKTPEVWSALEKVVEKHPILLNRAPTLHRAGIQAFYPRLVEGQSIQLHPLVCSAFNADFDGDQMAVHVPLSEEAKIEADIILTPTSNLLNPSNGKPLALPSREIILGLYYLTAERENDPKNPLKGHGTTYASPQEVTIALNNHKLHTQVAINLFVEDSDGKKQKITTTPGRVLFNQILPKGIHYVNEPISSRNIKSIVRTVFHAAGPEATSKFLDEAKNLGFQQAHQGGLTFGIDDMIQLPDKAQIIKEAKDEVEQKEQNYQDGLITERERSNQIIDIWTSKNIEITNKLNKLLKQDRGGFNSLYLMMASGARGSKDQMKQLCGMKGLVSRARKSTDQKEEGIIEHAITSSYAEGLTPSEYFTATHGSRMGLASATLKTSEAGYLTRKLVDVAQSIVITEEDCNTRRSRNIYPIYLNGQLSIPIGKQVVGRILAEDIIDPTSKKVLYKRNTAIDAEKANHINKLSLPYLQVRSPIHCEAALGICAHCYGINLGSNRLAEIGDAVGVIAAHSISEQGTQFTLRTFHKGGSVTGGLVEDTIKALQAGSVTITNCNTVNLDGENILLSRNSELKVIEEKTGEEIQNYIIPHGAHIYVGKNQKVEKGQVLFKHDPYNRYILAHEEGTVRFENVEEGITYKEEYNRETGHKERIIITAQDKKSVPAIIIEPSEGESASYTIPTKALLAVQEGQKVRPGNILAKISLSRSKPRDIVGGLPLISKLFEMHRIVDQASVSAISGKVTYSDRKRGNQIITVTSPVGIVKEYKVPLSKQILVQEGDLVQAGDLLSEGMVNPQDILFAKGVGVFTEYMIQEIQDIYRSQGIQIDDKHIEIILRRMLSKVRIKDSGDTNLVPDAVISRSRFEKVNRQIEETKVITQPGDSRFTEGQFVPTHQFELENKAMAEQNLKPAEARQAEVATATNIVQGITKQSLNSDSFVANAAFQETIKTLVKATVAGKTDPLNHIKESVILGKPIPAGTGMPYYRDLRVRSKEEERILMEEMRQQQEASVS